MIINSNYVFFVKILLSFNVNIEKNRETLLKNIPAKVPPFERQARRLRGRPPKSVWILAQLSYLTDPIKIDVIYILSMAFYDFFSL